MTKHLVLSALGVLGAGALLSLGGGVAGASINQVAPSPNVTVDTPAFKGQNAVRNAPIGEVTAQGSVIDCKIDVVCADGKVGDTVQAAEGSSKATPFGVGKNAKFMENPPMGNWDEKLH